MILSLFLVFLVLSLVLVALGLFVSEHTELSLIGFVFLFLLSLILLNNNLSYVNGYNTTSSFSYSTIGNNTLLTSSIESVIDNTTPVNLEDNLNHVIGYWLAVCSVLGFAGILWSIKKERWN